MSGEIVNKEWLELLQRVADDELEIRSLTSPEVLGFWDGRSIVAVAKIACFVSDKTGAEILSLPCGTGVHIVNEAERLKSYDQWKSSSLRYPLKT